MGAFQSHEALRSEYHTVVCTASRVTLWSKVVPLDGSEAPLVVKSILRKSEDVYFVILNLYNGFETVKTQRFKKMQLSLAPNQGSRIRVFFCFTLET